MESPSSSSDASVQDADWIPQNQLRHWIDDSGPYWLTRFVVLRFLGLVYFVAFLTAALQLVPLVGESGITPVSPRLDVFVERAGGTWQAFLKQPSLFYFDCSDTALLAISWLGLLGSLVVLLGFANSCIMAVLWFFYLSITTVGLHWYSFGWEIQLCETGFLAIFLCPLLDGRPFSSKRPPKLVVWLYWWLIFRIMLGAGLIKWRGDACWRDLTCLIYHYETQPIPHPLSWLIHQAPEWVHKFGVLFNHVVELICPFLLFGPRLARRFAAATMLLFQCALILSGNLAFLNWLTIVPILACFDDRVWERVLPGRWVRAAQAASQASKPSRLTFGVSCAVFAGIAVLSLNPISNLLASRQRMNSSFDRLHLVNTYGAFGSVGDTRYELVFEGTSDAEIGSETHWVEYDFLCKPDQLDERPCIITPYHMRLDWLLWFAAMGSVEQYPWVVNVVDKMLHNHESILTLIGENPFPQAPPRWLRVERYVYTFTSFGEEGWWQRRRLGPYLSPLRVEDIRRR